MALQSIKHLSEVYSKIRYYRMISTTLHSSNQFYTSVREVMNKWQNIFATNNIPEPKQSIEYIVAYTLDTQKISDVHKWGDRNLSINEINQIDHCCTQRLKRMPIQYIIKTWNFRNLRLKMEPPVFIPWPETEKIVDLVLKELPIDSKETILELCCGSGAICLSILKERPSLKVIAVDKLKEACNLTMENAERHGMSDRIKVIQDDLRQFNHKLLEKQSFDLIVSNPPYVPKKDFHNLPPEMLEYEYLDALNGGIDGLKMIKVVINVAKELLNVDGKLFMEVDPSEPELLKKWLQDNPNFKLSMVQTHLDYTNKKRFVEIIKI